MYPNSNLILNSDIKLENFSLSGSLLANKDLINAQIENKIQLLYKEVNVEDAKVPEYLKIRGYDLEGVEAIAKV